MGQYLIRKVSSAELKSVIETTSNAHWVDNLLIMQPKFGQCVLNFTDPLICTCVLQFKRISGNGLVLVSSGEFSKEYQIVSKSVQSASSQVINGKVSLHRTQRSRGDLALLDVSLYKDEDAMVNWNAIISRCEDYACLRLVGDQLHASDGAWIKGTNIQVFTDPPNMCSKTGNTVKFLGSCRILEIQVDDTAKVIDPPVAVLTLPVNATHSVLTKADTQPIQVPVEFVAPTQQPPPPEPTLVDGKVIYDTKTSGFSQSYCNKHAQASVGGVTIDQVGSYSIPLRMLTPNTRYVISVQVARVTGNGKFMFGILPDKGQSIVQVAAGPSKTYSTEVKSVEGGTAYSLTIWRHPTAKGRVHLSRILVLSEAEVPPLEAREVPASPIFVYDEGQAGLDVEVPTAFNQSVTLTINGVNDEVTKNFLEYSRPVPQTYTIPEPINLQSSLVTNTLSGRLWMNQISKAVQGINVAEEPFASISSIYKPIKAKKMYIEEFNDTISDEALSVIGSADEVFVASNLNAEKLRGSIDKPIKVRAKAFPYVQPEPLGLAGSDYVLFWNEDSQVTDYVISALSGVDVRIVLLGARGKYPKNVFPVNEYLPYPNMLHLFGNARCYIDLPIIEDHVSGYVSLGISMGAQVITTSWAYMDNPQVIFITGSEQVGTRLVPSANNLAAAVSNAKSCSPVVGNVQPEFESFVREFLT